MKISLIIVLVLLSIPATALLFLQNEKVQTYLTRYVAEELSKELQTEIRVDKVSVTFLNRIQLRHLYLQDLNGDTLLYAEKVKARIRRLNRSKQELSIGRLAMDNAYIHLITDSAGVINLKFIIDRIKNPGKEKKSDWKTTFDRIELINSHFQYTRKGIEPDSDAGINFQDMNLHNLQVRLADFGIQGDTISYDIKNLSFTERSGFQLGNMNARMSLSKRHMFFSNVFLETPLSSLSANQIRFNFQSYDDFSDFVNKVKTSFNFRSSSVNFIDIGYFAPAFMGYDQTVKVSGLVTGRISDMTGKNILLSYNDHTSLEGSFNMIGLPDFRQTFMHFNIRQLTTNIHDIKMLKLPGNRKIHVPQHFDRLGMISYSGKFTGYIDDFVAYGTFNSRLGQLSSDLLIKPDALNGLKFKGRVKSRSFNIGKLTSNDKLIGNISMALNVDGYTSQDTLSANISGKIDSLGFYNYTYKRINLSGLLSNKKFDGTVNIDDPNLKMEFLGKVDFGLTEPKFNFTANVSSVRPYYLNIDKSDPDYFASFLLKTNFTGRDIDDINGEIKLVNSFFQKSDKQIQIYDLSLVSKNSADTNRISVKSDILDGELKGHYQFSTLGGSFKNMAFHYLPTLAQDNLWVPDSTDKNNFSFNLNLKKISSVVNFFLPDYELADSSYFAGKYNPAELEIDLIGNCPMFGFYGNRWNGLQIITSSDFNKTELLTRSRSLILKNNLSLDNLSLNAAVFNDTVTLNLDWNSFEKPKY
ncbi:MAG TPA: AsmA family protein, partial [Bacteroidales bacterium]|nr:AsmA family protein [Bacteroidales bacterium]